MFFKRWRLKRKHRALVVAISMLASACSSYVKPTVKSNVSTTVVSKADLEFEEALYAQLKGVNSKSEIKRIIKEFKSNKQKRERLAKLLLELTALDKKFNLTDLDYSSYSLLSKAEIKASYNYFYGKFEKGKLLLDVTKRELAKLDEEFALLVEVEVLIGGKFGWLVSVREDQVSNDIIKMNDFKGFFNKCENVFVAEFESSEDKKYIKALKDLRLLVRKLHELYSKTDLAYPKTQEYLQDFSINLGGTIESLE